MKTSNHPKEYNFKYELGMEEVINGDYVKKDDYTKLRCVNERLLKRIQDLKFMTGS